MEDTAESKLYSLLATLFSAPKEDFVDKVQECIAALRTMPQYPKEVVEEIEAVEKATTEIPLDDIQGIFSYSFELSAECTLDLGFHLFDGFKRSNTLVAMKEMYKAHGFDYDEIAKGELPDSLPVVLKFLAMVDDEGLKNEFREGFLIKALEKLAKNFESNKDNIYGHLITALVTVIEIDVQEAA